MKWAAVCLLITMYLMVGGLVTRVICEPTKEVLQLVAMVSVPPDSNHHRITQDWERGLEILPGARVAVQEVNRKTDVLPGYQLELVELITEGCSDNLALVQLVQHLVSQAESEGERESIGIIGPLCNDATSLVATVAGHPAIGLVQIAATPFALSDDRSDHPYLFQMLPLSQSYINTVLGLMKAFGWDMFGLLCAEAQNMHNCQTASAFQVKAIEHGMQALYSARMGPERVLTSAIQPVLKDLKESGAKIIAAFIPPIVATRIVCAAYREGLSWPEYVWILPGLKFEHFEESESCDRTLITSATEGLLLLDYATPNLQTTTVSDNGYISAFYDSVWAFALALNQSNLQWVNQLQFGSGVSSLARSLTTALSNLSFSGSTGHIEFDNNRNRKYVAIQVNHIREGSMVLVAHYNPYSSSVEINTSSTGNFPDDELDTVFGKISMVLTVIITAEISLTFVFTTIMLLLYIHYRNEPEVKATSTVLSMFIFLGCYLQLLSTIAPVAYSNITIHNTAEQIAICQLQVYFTFTGRVLILSTLFVRMLRVYRVFTYFGRTGKAWSNQVLATLILSIVLVNILLLSLWAVINPIQVTSMPIYHPEGTPPYFEAKQFCDSENLHVWLIVASAYSVLLTLAVLILAFLTRNIRRTEFKDTKKVSIFIAASVAASVIAFLLYIIYRAESQAVLGLVLSGEVTAAFLCQLLLFLPKTGPPLLRHLRTKQHK